METAKDLNKKILTLTIQIQEKYPELSKYIVEMTDTMPDEKHPNINNEKLNKYYESLNAMLIKYKEGHPISKI